MIHLIQLGGTVTILLIDVRCFSNTLDGLYFALFFYNCFDTVTEITKKHQITLRIFIN